MQHILTSTMLNLGLCRLLRKRIFKRLVLIYLFSAALLIYKIKQDTSSSSRNVNSREILTFASNTGVDNSMYLNAQHTFFEKLALLFGQNAIKSPPDVYGKKCAQNSVGLNGVNSSGRPTEDIHEAYEFQRVSDDLLIFSAHYDPRLTASPLIVIIGLTANYINKTRISRYGFCYVWYRNDEKSRMVEANLTIVQENHDLM